jgi:ubiquitin C-terminal hydrolase
MKAVSILHQLHDTLFVHLDSLQTFLNDNLQFFETKDEDLDEQWKCYFDQISRKIIHLRRWQRRLIQRMQRFDGMKDGVRRLCILIEVKSTLTPI